MIAYYLPQFYTFPQNDEWWGHGFTEWTNVRRAKPQYCGHSQPRYPMPKLGYYDLSSNEVFHKQITLAKAFGLYGFCFYFYMFNKNTRMLENPIDNYLNDKSLDFPFCLMFVNESWTRSWESNSSEILVKQEYIANYEYHLALELKKYLLDDRYIWVNGKPLVIIYRVHLLPNKELFSTLFREHCFTLGIGEIYLCSCFTNGGNDATQYGFDDNSEFPPHNTPKLELKDIDKFQTFKGKVFSYQKVLDESIQKKYSFPMLRGAMVGWDNTPRRLNEASIFYGSYPDAFQFWLENLIIQTRELRSEPEQIIFINSWNEWAEGSYLEPDLHNGYNYLQAIKNSLRI